MFTTGILDRLINAVDVCPWGSTVGHGLRHAEARRRPAALPPLYTAEERRRRDASPWTVVQGVLAPVQFAAFLVSLVLVVHTLLTDQGQAAATISVVTKTLLLYAIMLTGSVWEKVVFGRWLFARAFYWEDMFSLLVLALHTAYLVALLLGLGDARSQLLLALVAYAAYLINAAQFLVKLRAARREGEASAPSFAARYPG